MQRIVQGFVRDLYAMREQWTVGKGEISIQVPIVLFVNNVVQHSIHGKLRV